MNDAELPFNPRSDSDARWSAWMAAAQDGDQQAYRALLHGIVPYVRAMASRAFHEPADIEDAVQEVLITLHEVRASYDPTRPFRPWLAAIARHRIIDRMRQNGRIRAREAPLDIDHATYAALVPRDDNMTIDTHTLHAAIDRLPNGQRLALRELKLREGTLQEVSTATGLSEGSLKVATHRGIKRLRAMLTSKP